MAPKAPRAATESSSLDIDVHNLPGPEDSNDQEHDPGAQQDPTEPRGEQEAHVARVDLRHVQSDEEGQRGQDLDHVGELGLQLVPAAIPGYAQHDPGGGRAGSAQDQGEYPAAEYQPADHKSDHRGAGRSGHELARLDGEPRTLELRLQAG